MRRGSGLAGCFEPFCHLSIALHPSPRMKLMMPIRWRTRTGTPAPDYPTQGRLDSKLGWVIRSRLYQLSIAPGNTCRRSLFSLSPDTRHRLRDRPSAQTTPHHATHSFPTTGSLQQTPHLLRFPRPGPLARLGRQARAPRRHYDDSEAASCRCQPLWAAIVDTTRYSWRPRISGHSLTAAADLVSCCEISPCLAAHGRLHPIR